MASSIPCVVTDVGDSKDLVGNSGWTVGSGCKFKLANGMSKALSISRGELIKKDLRLVKGLSNFFNPISNFFV